MGFGITATTQTLVWPDDHELAGLEVTLRVDHTMQELLDLAESWEARREALRQAVEKDDEGEPVLTTADVIRFRLLTYEEFAATRLLDWTLTAPKGSPIRQRVKCGEGGAIPATYEGLCAIDNRVADAIVDAARAFPLEAISNPFAGPSTDGAPEAEASPSPPS